MDEDDCNLERRKKRQTPEQKAASIANLNKARAAMRRKESRRDESWPYDNPDTLDYNNVDEAIRELCKVINNTLPWMRTAESCAGHPRGLHAWSRATYLRVMVKDLNRFFIMIEDFNEKSGTNTPDLTVQFGGRYDSLGIAFHITFPECKDEGLRDIDIDLFKRIVTEGGYR